MAHVGTAQGARSRACPPGERREDGYTNILLALLLLAFATLMASAWFMARPPPEENQGPVEESMQDPGPTNVSSTPVGDLDATGSLVEVEALGTSVRAGDSVEVVWSSFDGATWKEVIDHPFAVLRVEENRITIRTSPEEKSKIATARSSGRVFGIPP